jgi:hypothetical protein
MDNDNTHEDSARQSAICLLGHDLARQRKNIILFEIQPARSTFFGIERARLLLLRCG